MRRLSSTYSGREGGHIAVNAQDSRQLLKSHAEQAAEGAGAKEHNQERAERQEEPCYPEVSGA